MTNKQSIKKQTILGAEVNTIVFSGSLPLFSTQDEFNVQVQIINEGEGVMNNFNFTNNVTLKKSELPANFTEEDIKTIVIAKLGLTTK